jgi:hypothetical protein
MKIDGGLDEMSPGQFGTPISRRFLLGATPLAVLAFAQPAHSASPPFYFVGPKLIVVDYRFEATTKELVTLLPQDEILPQLVSHLESEFSRLGIDIPITLRANSARLSADIYEDAILYVTIRIDASEAHPIEDRERVAIGAVSLSFSRQGATALSLIPYELFTSPLIGESVRSTVVTSAKKHLSEALIEPIARLHKK